MIEPRLLPETRDLIREAKQVFRRRGWSIREPNGLGLDFRAEVWELRYGFICVHQAILGILDTSRIMERLVAEHRSYTHQWVVAILDSDQWGLNFDRLEAEGISAVTLAELPLLVELDRLQHELPRALHRLQLRLIEGAPWACGDISNRFRAAGEIGEAIKWCRLAVAGARGNPVPHFKLFYLLLDTGDIDGAHQAGLDGLRLKPDEVGLLRGMRNIARRRGDVPEAARWDERLVSAERYQPGDFEKIIETQRRSAVAARGRWTASAQPTAQPHIGTERSTRSAGAWLSGLFGSGRPR